MSSSHVLADDPLPPLRNGSTAAADVSFAKLNPEHHAESNSRAESSRSSRERKSGIAERLTRDREKEHSGRGTPISGDRSSDGSSTPHRVKKSGGFLLDSVFTNGHPRGPDSAQRQGKASESNGQISIDKRKSAQSRLSGESSQRSSPLSREISLDQSNNSGKGVSPRPPNMDPAQLVQMALNLSESRKRHVSSSLPVPVTPAGGRRVVSALDSGYGTVKSTPSSGNRASYLRNATPDSQRLSRDSGDRQEPSFEGENVVYTFSPATLSRAEKARRYFELASEHRRLLEHLPPLKSDATAPGNYTLQATSSPGSAHYDMSRVQSNTNSKRQLGRSYNPLQALRNRRLRNRERRPLTAPPDTWQQTDRIKRWIDGVEATSNDPSYRPGDDQVRLPPFSGELEAEPERPETAKRHRRSDTVNSVITRPDNGWSVEPAELLADTYWVEKGDNKTVIEDRNGNRIFPGRFRQSLEVPRRSKEYDLSTETYADEQSHNEDSGDDEKGKSRRRHLLPIPGRLRRSYVSRSPSTTSNSSDEGRKPPAPRFGHADGGDENIGPLEKHMRAMIAKEERGELSSPELVSPDHWDAKNEHFQHGRRSVDRSRRESHQAANGRLSVDSRGHRRAKSAEGRRSVDHGLTSMNEMVSDSPNSPVVAGFVSTAGLTRSNSKRTSPTEEKTKRSHIPVFRSRSKDRNNIERTDFASMDRIGKPLSPVLSADSSTGQPRSSLDSNRPPQFLRQRTADSNTSSLGRVNTTTTATDTSMKDSNSSLPRRILKGGRIGELMRNESSRLGDRFRGSRDRLAEPGVISDMSLAASDVSEDERDQPANKRGRREETDTDSQVSPRASLERERPKPKYYISNLPSFKSPSGRYRSSTIETPMSEASDPFAKHGREVPSRNAHLVPPKINLPDEDGSSEPEMRDRKMNNILGTADYDRRKSVSQNNLSTVPTNSTDIRPRKRGDLPITGLSGHDARRHWSISDQGTTAPVHKVTTRDIARVRALLLSSGIKAHEIYMKANTGREAPVPVIAKAFETAGKPLPKSLSKKDENIITARMLSNTLETELSHFEKTLQHFQAETAKDLSNELDELSHRASEQLTKIVHETSDEADAFNVELTTKQPQEVKRVDEAVDAMFRQRRRQFRLVRRAGFKLLEWMVLGIMWWVWFVVVVINSLRKVIVGILLVLKWLLWL